jgi:quinol monooxygenase YgiN
MVVLTGCFTARPDSLPTLLELCHSMYPPSRSEAGCLSYNLWTNSSNGTKFMFFEEWKDREALKTHFQTPHFTRFMSIFPSMIEGEPVIRIYEASGPQSI